MIVRPKMPAIPFYDYQKRVSEGILNDILEKRSEINIQGCKVAIKVPIVRLESPLGSGKTRIMCRVVSLLWSSDKRTTDHRIVTIDGVRSDTPKSVIPSKIIINVPVSIMSQWITELETQEIKYTAITTPKMLREVMSSNPIDGIFLISDLRMKDLWKSHEEFLARSHIFVDEYDTISSVKMIGLRERSSTMTICSASKYEPLWQNKFWDIEYHNHVCTQDEVDVCINLPEIIESKISFTMGLTLKKLMPVLGEYDKSLISSGNYKDLFDRYKVSLDRLDLLIEAMIDIEKSNLSKHLSLPTIHQNSTYIARTKYRILEMETILAKDWSKPDLINCTECFTIMNRGETCESCQTGSSIFSRVCILNKIMKSIELRPGRTKRVLIYCSTDSLVDQLKYQLEKDNRWTIILNGTATQRTKLINKFKSVDQDIYMLCNSINNSAGIHLPETTDIILYHSMDERYEIQIVGRGQRIGRIDQLYVHRIENLM